MFPVYVYEEGMDLPKKDTYFVVASNGIYLHKDTGLFEGFVKVDQISCIADLPVDTLATTSLPKIPHALVMKIRRFFAQVFEKHHAEACVLLYYNEADGCYFVVAPEQQVSHVAVIYRKEPLSVLFGEEFRWAEFACRSVGTIHSHCDFGAFHSGTDDADESTFDGLHLTFGHVNRASGMSVSASIVLNGQRTKIDPLSILEGVTHVDDDAYMIDAPQGDTDYESLQREVDSWMERVNRR